MRRACVVVAALAALAACVGPLQAEPYLALRTGLDCSACHANRSGGGGRTAYGASYGATALPWKRILGKDGLFDGTLGARVRVGADARGGYRGHLRNDGPYLGEIQLSELNLYVGVDLLPDRLKLYVDERVAPGGATNREAFALYSLRRGFYIKGGKFFLPYGLRLQDDDAANRRGTGFTFESSDLGVEVGGAGERWAATLAISNGTAGAAEQDNRKRYTASGVFLAKDGRVGVSISDNALPMSARRVDVGIFGGFHADRLVVLAEVDRTLDRDATGKTARGGAGHVEVDIAAPAGLTVRAWGGAYDLDRSDAIPRYSQWGAGADWTPIPGLQLRLLYRRRDGPATVDGSRDDEALVEAHVFF